MTDDRAIGRPQPSQGDGFKISSPHGYIEYRPVNGTNEIWWVESKKPGHGSELVDAMMKNHPAESIAWGATSKAGEGLRKKWHANNPRVADATGGERSPFDGQFDPYDVGSTDESNEFYSALDVVDRHFDPDVDMYENWSYGDESDLQDLLGDLRERHPLHQLEAFYDPDTDSIHLDRIVVKQGHRKQGVGTQIMKSLTGLADRKQKTMSLQTAARSRSRDASPMTAGWGTTSRSRLVRFYGKHGFKENSSKRSYRPELLGDMHRIPKPQVERHNLYRSAAIKHKGTGEVFEGTWHGDAIDKMQEAKAADPSWGGYVHSDWTHGFVTDDGTFETRSELRAKNLPPESRLLHEAGHLPKFDYVIDHHAEWRPSNHLQVPVEEVDYKSMGEWGPPGRFFNDSTQQWQEVRRETPYQGSIKEDPDHVYHVTTRKAAESIKKHGFRSGRGQAMRSGYPHTQPAGTYFTEASGVPYWHGKAWEHLTAKDQTLDHYDDPTKHLAVLKVKREHVPPGLLEVDDLGTSDAGSGKAWVVRHEEEGYFFDALSLLDRHNEYAATAIHSNRTGQIFTGPMHVLAHNAAAEAGHEDAHNPYMWTDGFITHDGKFVDREEANARTGRRESVDLMASGHLPLASKKDASRATMSGPKEAQFRALHLKSDAGGEERHFFDALDLIDRHNMFRSAAIKHRKTGRIYEGTWHEGARQAAADEYPVHGSDPWNNEDDFEDGFMTHDGKFLDRGEAEAATSDPEKRTHGDRESIGLMIKGHLPVDESLVENEDVYKPLRTRLKEHLERKSGNV